MSALDDALLAARLCAIEPRLGGLALRGGGEARDAVVTALAAGRAVRRLPINIDESRLSGGLDLTATLASGRTVMQRGLLEDIGDGVLVVPMAERLPEGTAARIATAMDGGAAFTLVLLDDGIEAEERPAAALLERLAFWVDLSAVPSSVIPALSRDPADAAEPRPAGSRLEAGMAVSGEVLEAIAATALALGIDSARASQFAIRAARASAALHEQDAVDADDVALVARLVLGPRATRLPERPADEAEAPPPPEAQDGDSEQDRGEPEALADVVLAAVAASLPPDVLAKIAAGRSRKTSRSSGAGERRKSAQRGRPKGTRAGSPRGGLRLSLIDTLIAAAPWQKLRSGGDGRVRIRRDDLRIRRFETRAEATTIFAVDASGSSALARLAEAKGAVELLLAEAYVKRAQVALVAFRGTTAELLLPPTRSLARARRSLAELPGGGGTPLAAGLNAARELAEAARGRGRTPFVVVLTDGRANIAADGSMVRSAAEADATMAAKAIGAAGIASAFVDISARPRPEGAALAAAMGARYLPLPRADAATMHAAVRAAQPV